MPLRYLRISLLTPACGMKSKWFDGNDHELWWTWLSNIIRILIYNIDCILVDWYLPFQRECAHLYSPLLCTCSLDMIRNQVMTSQWTQSIEFPINSRNSWISCTTNNLTISNHGMIRNVHNMYCDLITIQITKSFWTYMTESPPIL